MPENLRTASIDPFQTELFFRMLAGEQWEDEPFVFQTFDDNKTRKNKSLSKVICGKFSEVEKRLITLNRNGACISVTVNRCEGGRTAERLRGYRAVWVDWDHGDREPPDWPLQPSGVVNSSPGKYHFYWVATGLDQDTHWRIMSVLEKKWGNDPSANDAVRCLRLPGFMHQKDEPFLVTITTDYDDRIVYSVQDVLAAFKVPDRESPPASPASRSLSGDPKKSTKTPFNKKEVEAALTWLKADDREVWLKVGMALASTGHGERAFTLWDAWSRQSDKYDVEDQYRVWQSFRENKDRELPETPVTIGSLFKLAQAAGFRLSARPIDVPSRSIRGPEATLTLWEEQMRRDKNNRPVDSPSNVMLVLANHGDWKGRLRFNEFTGHTEIEGRRWQDQDDNRLLYWLHLHEDMIVRNPSTCTIAADEVAQRSPYHPIRDWLTALPRWDGVDRIGCLFIEYLGAKPSIITDWAARTLMRSLVARAFDPGCYVRTVVVLEGPEKIGKSAFVRALGYPWTREISANFDSQEVYGHIQGVWLGELMELDSISKATAGRVKAFLTQLEDNFRPPYGRATICRKRVTVFIGTTNEHDYLSDSGQNTRFVPIEVQKFRRHLFEQDRQQLFAQALQEYLADPRSFIEEPDDETFAEQMATLRDTKRLEDPWESLLSDFLLGRTQVDSQELYTELGIPKERRTKAESTRIGKIMARLGFSRFRGSRLVEGVRHQWSIYKKR